MVIDSCSFDFRPLKKTLPVMEKPPEHYDKKKISHTWHENPRTCTLPLHWGAVTLWAQARTFHVLWELAVGEKIFSLQPENSLPLGVRLET
jgi:hypothetical protein